MIARDLQTLIHQLEITTRKYVSGPLLGDAASKLKGSGFEFNQLREYIQGDDIRFIDWKASARSGKTLVRQYLEDRNRVMYIVADVSGSMSYGTTEQTKADMLKQLSGMLAFVGLHSKDAVGLILFSDCIEKIIPPRHSRAHILSLVKTIFTYQPTDLETNFGTVFDHLARLKGQRAVVCLVSDFMGQLGGTMMNVASRKHDVMALRILDPKEERFPSIGTLTFEDIESGKTTEVAGGQGASLDASLSFWHDQQRECLMSSQIDMLDITLGAPFVGDLLRFLRQRMGRR